MFTASDWLHPTSVLQTKNTPEVQHQTHKNYRQQVAKNGQTQLIFIL